MGATRLGPQTVALEQPPRVVSWGNIGGKWEAQGPLAQGFDTLNHDSFFGQKTWEQAEVSMQKTALQTALTKGKLQKTALDYVLAGDLLNQCIGSTFAMRDTATAYLGLYSACATFGEGLGLGAILLDGGFANYVAALSSSHFCAAERQYRTPMPYGNQRTPTAQWTATAAGCCILGRHGSPIALTHVTTGKVIDWGIKDANNMGAAMAPAAYDTLRTHFVALGTSPEDYDAIFTGDLGSLGHAIVADLFCKNHMDMTRNYQDCGMLLYDAQAQDMHAGGSGAGCSASVLCAHVLPNLQNGTFRRVLFAPTGALLSPTSSLQGQSIPGICHAVEFSLISP